MNNRFSLKMTVKTRLQFAGSQIAGRFAHLALGMNPAGFHRIEPRAFGRQAQDQQADIGFAFRPLVVGSNPVTHCFTLVPTGIVPDQHDDPLTFAASDVQQSGEEEQGVLAVRLPIGERQVDLIAVVAHGPIARQCFLLVAFSLALDQPEFLTGCCPGMSGGVSEPRKPTFIFLKQQPLLIPGRLLLQPIPSLFLTSYWLSGLVIQCLARRQPRPKRFNSRLMVVRSMTWGVYPSRAASSASQSSVHRLPSKPNSRGERRITPRNHSRPAASIACWSSRLARDFGLRLSSPPLAKARMASRTHWSLHLSRSPISRAVNRSWLLMSTIWLRRTVKAEDDLKPFSNSPCSSPVMVRTNKGALMPLSRPHLARYFNLSVSTLH